MGHPPGTILEVGVDDIFSDQMLASSHAVTLGSTLKVGLELFGEEMPGSIRIILIEAEDYFEFTDQCSPRVAAAVDRVIRRLGAEIAVLSGTPGFVVQSQDADVTTSISWRRGL